MLAGGPVAWRDGGGVITGRDLRRIPADGRPAFKVRDGQARDMLSATRLGTIGRLPMIRLLQHLDVESETHSQVKNVSLLMRSTRNPNFGGSEVPRLRQSGKASALYEQ
jgi:hypothetical protein